MEKIFDFVQATLNLFKALPNLSDEKFSDYKLDNEKNLAEGFFVTEEAFKVCPCVADKKIFDFLKKKFGYNIFELNQSFYKSFKTVAESSQQKILTNKLLHYMTTYGFESLGIFDSETVYIPNEKLELPENSTPVKITVITLRRCDGQLNFGAILHEQEESEILETESDSAGEGLDEPLQTDD